MKKEVEDSMSRLHAAQKAEEAIKQAQADIVQREISQLYQVFGTRTEFLKREAKNFLFPWIAVLQQAGVSEVLEELREEMAIPREVDIETKLIYFGKVGSEYIPEKLSFSGLSLDCDNWGFWDIDDYFKEEAKYLALDLIKEGLRGKIEWVNSVNPSGKYGFRSSGLVVSLSWEALRQHVPYHEIRFGQVHVNPYLPGSTRVIDHYIQGYFEGENKDVFYVVDGSQGLGGLIGGFGDESYPGEKVAFPKSKWGDKTLLRKIIAEACVRRVTFKKRSLQDLEGEQDIKDALLRSRR